MLLVIFEAYVINVDIVTIDEFKFVAKTDNAIDINTFGTISWI